MSRSTGRRAPATERLFTTAPSGSSPALLAGADDGLGRQGLTSRRLVGSQVETYRGTLLATVGASGKPTFERAGKSVRSLKAGRYEIAVSDESSRAGFFVARHGADTIGITSLPFRASSAPRHARRRAVERLLAVGRPTPFIVVTA